MFFLLLYVYFQHMHAGALRRTSRDTASCPHLVDAHPDILAFIDEEPSFFVLGGGRLMIEGVVGLERLWLWAPLLPFVGLFGFGISILEYVNTLLMFDEQQETVAAFSVSGLLASAAIFPSSVAIASLIALPCIAQLSRWTDNFHILDLKGRQLLYSHRFAWLHGERVLARFDEVDGVGVDSAVVADPDTGEEDHYSSVVLLYHDATSLRLSIMSGRSIEALNRKAKVLAQLMAVNFYQGSPGVSLRRSDPDGAVRGYRNSWSNKIIGAALLGFLVYLVYEVTLGLSP